MRFAILAFLSVSFLHAESTLWLRYPSISPDGETVVFSWGTDLYTVSSKGGEARQLTQHVKREYQPVWSPDGKWLAFASDRYGNDDIFVMPAEGGEAKRLTYHSAGDIPWTFTPDGSAVLFSSTRLDAVEVMDIPNRRIGELYEVPVEGGQPKMILTTPAEKVAFSADGKSFLYQDKKGYEDPWRKHHESSVARDLWRYDLADKSHTKVTDYAGEDRDPVWTGAESFCFLSEKSGSFNVWQSNLAGEMSQVTSFQHHPVRFLTRSADGKLAYGYDGSLYVQDGLEANPQKLKVTIRSGAKLNVETVKFSEGITEMKVSADGKQLAFIARGEVFVTSVEHGRTRRITNTPQQERSVDFHPEGRKLVYASEREGSWNLYTSEIVQEDEQFFFNATALKEEVLLKTREENFQPLYSPDGESVAFLHNREDLMVLSVDSGKVTLIQDKSRIYSYKDGDIDYRWSPDSRYLAVTLLQENRWTENIFLLRASGDGPVIDLTKNGYYDALPQWAWNGEAVTWVSNRHGKRAHGSWGSEQDVYIGFLTNRAHRLSQLAMVDRDAIEDEEWDKMFEEAKPLDPENLVERVERLTEHSCDLVGYAISKDGRKLFYMVGERDDHEIWERDLHKGETKCLAVMGGGNNEKPSDFYHDSENERFVVLSGGRLFQVSEKGDVKPVKDEHMMTVDRAKEREEMFEHVWRQVSEKFHRSDIHGVNWEFYRGEYEKFLPHIHHNYEFSEMLSEMLGELNASHTGSRYLHRDNAGDDTASLGVFLDPSYEGVGVKILEVIPRSPLALLDDEVEVGTVIEAINGVAIEPGENLARRLNRLAGKRTLLALALPDGTKRDEVIAPLSLRAESDLLYKRWVKRMRVRTEEISDGKIGFVHISGMSDGAFRELFSEVFGYHSGKEALIVDTRFNGGGWLTEDLTSFLTGQRYLRFYPREQSKIGAAPLFRWDRPSAVIMGEGNYSDAHLFPYAYKTMKIGKLVGMPVPGTGTAVWWERLIDQEILFGIPQTSTLDAEGNYLENSQLEPDIKVSNTPEMRAKGVDEQLKAAVKHLQSLPKAEKWADPAE